MWLLFILGMIVVLVVVHRVRRDGWHRPHRGGGMDPGQAGRDKGYWHAD